MKTRTEITVEVDRWVAINQRKKIGWCANCARDVNMLSVDEAAIFAGRDHRDQSGRCHRLTVASFVPWPASGARRRAV